MNSDTLAESDEKIGQPGELLYCGLVNYAFGVNYSAGNKTKGWDRELTRTSILRAWLAQQLHFLGAVLPDIFKVEIKTEGYDSYHLCVEEKTIIDSLDANAPVTVRWRPDDDRKGGAYHWLLTQRYFERHEHRKAIGGYIPKPNTGQNGNANNNLLPSLREFIEWFEPAIFGYTDCVPVKMDDGRPAWKPTKIWCNGQLVYPE